MEAATGTRMLAEVEETSLSALLDSLRDIVNRQNATTGGRIKITHNPDLDAITARHFQSTQSPTLSLSGRHLPFLYNLVSSLISHPHHYAVLIIDLDARFDATRLTCDAPSDTRHVYVHRPARNSPEKLRELVADAENFLLYGAGAEASASREWWGTVVIGGLAAGDVLAGWKGWLRVDREKVMPFPLGISAEEALEKREARQAAVDKAGWVAASPWGGLVFPEGPRNDGE